MTYAHILDNYKIEDRGYITSCHVYQGSISNEGYARFHTTGKEILLHREAFKVKYGYYPPVQTDHKCRVRSCINAEHLESTSIADNVLRGNGVTAINARKTHCKRGHELTTRKRAGRKTSRYCKTCNAMASAKAYHNTNPTAIFYSKRNSQSKG